MDGSQSSSRSGSTSRCLDADDRYKILTERIQTLEEKFYVSKDELKPHQSVILTEELVETARYQVGASQEPGLGFVAIPDASMSSTCTLTPASVSRRIRISEISRLTMGRLW